MDTLLKLLGVSKNHRQEKADYHAFKKRITQLPPDYQFVFKQIERYLWEFSDYAGTNMLAALQELLVMFEDGAANQQDVFSITGNDVGEFANSIVREVANTWLATRQDKLNQKINHYRQQH